MRNTHPSDTPGSTESILRMMEDISAELELEPLLASIVEHASALVGADYGSVVLLDDPSTSIQMEAVFQMPARELGSMVRPGVGLAGRVLSTGKPVRAHRADLDDNTLTHMGESHFVGVPMHWKERLIGFFAIGKDAPQTIDDVHVEALSALARHAAIAIENARRYARERRRAVRFEMISRVSSIISAGRDLDELLQQTADAIHDVLEFPNVDIPMMDPDNPSILVVSVRGGHYKRHITGEDRVPLHRSIMGAAVLQRRSQRVDDVTHDARYIRPPANLMARAELAVPIMLGGEVFGVVNVEGDQAFDELDERTLEIVADHLAFAIHNARLMEQGRKAAVSQERQRLRHELHDSVTQILSSINLLAQALPATWRNSAEDGERCAQRLVELAQTAFAEMRALLRELQPPAEKSSGIARPGRNFLGIERLKDAGLASALSRLLDAMIPDNLTRRYQWEHYIPQALPHEEALYRVGQEAISNVIRHSNARSVVVEARVESRTVHLVVRDDGHGMTDEVHGGIGMKSMQQRMSSLGGSLRLVRIAPHGLEVEAVLPRADRILENAS